MEQIFRPILTQAGEVLPDDPAVRGFLLLTNAVFVLLTVASTWRWLRAPAQKDRTRISVDQPAGQYVSIKTGEQDE